MTKKRAKCSERWVCKLVPKKRFERNNCAESQVEIVRQSQIGHCTHSLNEYSGICHLIALVVGSSRYLDMEQENDRPNK